MAEYIDKSAVVAKIDEFVEINKAHGFPVDIFDMEMLKKIIENIPAADVAPVVHGQWVYNPNGMDWNLGAWQCSVCKCNNNNLPGNDKYNPYIFQGSNYCPNCGAKMDEKEG